MFPLERILLPTDFSEASRQSLAVAADMASDYGAELLIVHVIEPLPAVPPDPDFTFEMAAYQDAVSQYSDERMAELLAGLDETLAVRTMVCHGEPAREIVRLAENEDVDLIVIPTHGLTGLKHLVFGSVAERVVRTACCPVLTLRRLSSASQAGEE